jgi:hypothetical protein
MPTTTAVVVPSCRPERTEEFLAAWDSQFKKHDCRVMVVKDGEYPTVHIPGSSEYLGGMQEIVPMGYQDCLRNRTPAIRNLGFVAARERWSPDFFVTLDDDLVPDGDTIGDHLHALNSRVPTSWISSTLPGSPYMRGFPYAVRKETPVWVSHGVWKNIPDLDAPTQLVLGDSPSVEFYRGPIPNGVMFPFCGMNVAFRKEALPFMYWAPVRDLRGAERFDDIWMGINMIPQVQEAGGAIVTGMASCVHTRLSDTMKNLGQEHYGIALNERYWQGDKSGEEWFNKYEKLADKWRQMWQKTF